jgi:hypothetical protein
MTEVTGALRGLELLHERGASVTVNAREEVLA